MPGLVAALAPLVDTEAGPGLSPWLAHDSSSHTWAWARPWPVYNGQLEDMGAREVVEWRRLGRKDATFISSTLTFDKSSKKTFA